MTVSKLPRTIRLDASDVAVFERAAEPGEWAVAGGFAFIDAAPERLTGKRRQAFANGFLGTDSLGWSTFVVVASADEATVEAVAQRLARLFVEAHGAPSLEAALPVARQEVAFMADLCREHPAGTLLAMERLVDPDGGIRERFRVIDRSAGVHGRAWDAVAEDDAGVDGSRGESSR
jgi:hypothetical protein